MSELELEEIQPHPDVEVELPATLPVLPLKETVVFPQSMTPLAIGQERSVKLVDDVANGDRMLALVTAKNSDAAEPGFDDLNEVGTAAVVHKLLRAPDGTLRILVQGLRRIRLTEHVQDSPYLVAGIEEVPDEVEETTELEALKRNVQELFVRVIERVPYLPDELQEAIRQVDDPSALAHLVASTLRLKTEEKQRLLEQARVDERLRTVTEILNRELEVLDIGLKVQSEMEKNQREYFLRQQLKAIQEELGEADDQQAEINELRGRIEELDLPEDVEKATLRELGRLEKLPPASAEYGVIRTYLDWILSLPWGTTTADNLDLEQARAILDEDHFDLDKVKERIVEYLAVAKLKEDLVASAEEGRSGSASADGAQAEPAPLIAGTASGALAGPILCFVGPPGVGKTSLGHSIARTLGRKFVRISVGGVRDEAEIRGHRRTYIGAMPGTIIRAIRDAESMNPVFLIDEIDKMGADFRGDPASAMLEVLDPEQHATFRDHYLDLPFDLSKVLFICTANQLETIPGALLDRMDVIHLSGYTEEEKLQIARRYLVPKQLREHGLAERPVTIADGALRLVIRAYTREAGVRGLERQIAALCRKAARRVAEGKADRIRIDARRVRSWRGAPRFPDEIRKRTAEPGVATGLAVTAVGGDVLFIEATSYAGRGRLKVTGQLGDVMQESAEAAHSWVRSHASQLGLRPQWFADHDVHVHIPAGAVPKDGPSAGITMATAIVSLVSGRPVSEEVAMTGEITLTGQVLPVGGIRDKVLAAKRYGVAKVIVPRENEPDVEELPKEARVGVEFVLADTIEQVLEIALDGKPAAKLRPAAASRTAASSA